MSEGPGDTVLSDRETAGGVTVVSVELLDQFAWHHLDSWSILLRDLTSAALGGREGTILNLPPRAPRLLKALGIPFRKCPDSMLFRSRAFVATIRLDAPVLEQAFDGDEFMEHELLFAGVAQAGAPDACRVADLSAVALDTTLERLELIYYDEPSYSWNWRDPSIGRASALEACRTVLETWQKSRTTLPWKAVRTRPLGSGARDDT